MNSAGSTLADIFLDKYITHPLFFNLVLLRIEKIGPISFQNCLQAFGSAEKALTSSAQQLRENGLVQASIDQCQNFKNNYRQKGTELQNSCIFKGVVKDIDWSCQPNHSIIFSNDNYYPKQLKQIYDFPPLLFVIGNTEILNSNQLAIVGSRRPSKLGAIDAQQFSKDLADKGFTITSGLASGIDTFAHIGALESSSKITIAVLAHGLDSLYPKRNQALAASIVNQGGALVSEFPVGVTPRPEYFPRRNRIISGMSEGVLVVEAAVKSGSLITAYSALDQNREVFAIPGSIHNPVAKGCHKLIQNGAKLVECCDDILEELGNVYVQENLHKNSENQAVNNNLSMQEKALLNSLSHEEQTQNELAQQLSMPIHEISSTITMLELKGFVLQGEVGFIRAPQKPK
jgi:DNA processing protein